MNVAMNWKLTLGILIGAGLLAIGGSLPAVAQVTNLKPLEEFQNPDGKADPFSSRGSGQASGVMDLIQRAILAPSKNSEEFIAEQQENLDAATAEFRARQKERLRQQPAAVPATPVVEPTVPTP
jgi:hypothetical protein